ncbi:hypothetical protein CRENBAI_016326 [Crenichthys baileyi]|uniref:Uncharacterized protein n=1 Tax=Crenichthys baileyi TaxID=28760 RepID=A0AAV9RXW9_9TELE
MPLDYLPVLCTLPALTLTICGMISCHSYNLELSPTLIFQAVPGITVTIFPKGSIHINGAKSIDEVHKGFDAIYQILICFRKQ